MSKNWIAGAIKHPGALRRAAHHAHMTTAQYARAHAHDKGVTGRRARLALTLGRMRRRK